MPLRPSSTPSDSPPTPPPPNDPCKNLGDAMASLVDFIRNPTVEAFQASKQVLDANWSHYTSMAFVYALVDLTNMTNAYPNKQFVDTIERAAKTDPDIVRRIVLMRRKLARDDELLAEDPNPKLTQEEATELLEDFRAQGFEVTGLDISGYQFGNLILNMITIGGDLNMSNTVINGRFVQRGTLIRGSNIQDGVIVTENNQQYGIRIGGDNIQTGMVVYGDNQQKMTVMGNNDQRNMRIGGFNEQRSMTVYGTSDQTGMTVQGEDHGRPIVPLNEPPELDPV